MFIQNIIETRKGVLNGSVKLSEIC